MVVSRRWRRGRRGRESIEKGKEEGKGELVGRKNIEKFAYLRPILTNKMNNNLHFPPLHIMNALSIDTLPLIEFHTHKKNCPKILFIPFHYKGTTNNPLRP